MSEILVAAFFVLLDTMSRSGEESYHIEFRDYSYQEITSKEKLLEVLSYLLRIGDFKQYAGKTILDNVYMDLRGKKPVFKRTRTAMERNNIFSTIRRYAKKLKL